MGQRTAQNILQENSISRRSLQNLTKSILHPAGYIETRIVREAYQLLLKEEELSIHLVFSGTVLAKFCAQNKVPQWELA